MRARFVRLTWRELYGAAAAWHNPRCVSVLSGGHSVTVHRRRTMREIMRLLLLLVVAASLVMALGAQSPTFESGDPGALSVKVVKVRRCEETQRKASHYGCLVSVEVHNRGDLLAEPTVFEVVAKKDRAGRSLEPVRVKRFAGSLHGRAGRAIEAGARLRYTFFCPSDLPKRGVKASVARASFFRGACQPELTMRVRNVEHEKFTYGNVTPQILDLTRCEVTNPLAHPVDAAFRVVLEKPYSGRALLLVHLEPNETKRWEIQEQSYSNRAFLLGPRARKFELVDWSVHRDDGRGIAAKAFRDVWRRWRRWSDHEAKVSGRFEYEYTEVPGPRSHRKEPRRLRVQGAFTITGERSVDVQPSASIEESDAGRIEWGLARAFDPLRRPPADEVATADSMFLVQSGDPVVLGFRGRGWDWRSANDGSEMQATLSIRDGAIVASGYLDGLTPPHRWHTRQQGDGFVVTGIDMPNHRLRFDFEERGGRLLPISYFEAHDIEGVISSRTQLTIFDVEVTGAAQPSAVDAGPAATELRSAWDACYRYPDGSVTLRGRFHAENKGRNEHAWLGVNRVKGAVTISGFDGRRYRGAEVEIRQKIDAGKRKQVEFMVMDRFRIWSGRDFCARPSFDDAFAGATVSKAPDDAGVFRIENGPYFEVVVRDGRIVELVYDGGTRRKIGYTKVGAHVVPTSLRTGRETVTAKFQAFRGWLIPVEFRFDKVFGEDWGPETLKLTKLKVE